MAEGNAFLGDVPDDLFELRSARGVGGDVPDEHGTLRGATGTSEIFIRRQFGAWLKYMTETGN